MRSYMGMMEIVEAAKLWAEERYPRDAYERYLMAMVAKNFSTDWHTSDDCEHCSEEDRVDCSECPSRADLNQSIERSMTEMESIQALKREYVKTLKQETTDAQLHDQK